MILIDVMPYVVSGIWDWVDVTPSHFGLSIKGSAPKEGTRYETTHKIFYALFHALLLKLFDYNSLGSPPSAFDPC